MDTDRDPRPGTRISRRGILSGLGAGVAGAAALSPHPAAAAAPAATPADRFGRIFPDLPPFVPADDRRRAALIDLGKPGGLLDANDNLAVGPVLLITDPNQSL